MAIILTYVYVREGGYIGLWAWLHVAVSSGWSKVRNHVTSDPRFDVIVPRPLCRVFQWLCKLDSKVTDCQCYFLSPTSLLCFHFIIPSPPVDCVWAVVIIGRLRGKILRTVPMQCCVRLVHSGMHTTH